MSAHTYCPHCGEVTECGQLCPACQERQDYDARTAGEPPEATL